MLSEPERRWQVQELAAASQVSLGLAAKVKQTLVAEGYAVERDRRLLLRDPDALLHAWAQAYDRRVASLRLFVPGKNADATIARWLESHGVTFALTDLAGAWRAARTAEATRIAFWVTPLPEPAWADLREATGGARVESGENVVLYPTDDPSLFAGARLLGEPPLPTVSPLQLYLDLQLLDDGADAAAAVYEQELEGRLVASPRQSGLPA